MKRLRIFCLLENQRISRDVLTKTYRVNSSINIAIIYGIIVLCNAAKRLLFCCIYAKMLLDRYLPVIRRKVRPITK